MQRELDAQVKDNADLVARIAALEQSAIERAEHVAGLEAHIAVLESAAGQGEQEHSAAQPDLAAIRRRSAKALRAYVVSVVAATSGVDEWRICDSAEYDDMKEDIDKLKLKDEGGNQDVWLAAFTCCLLYTSPSPRDGLLSRMPSSA